jgi:hypothetical protein
MTSSTTASHTSTPCSFRVGPYERPKSRKGIQADDNSGEPSFTRVGRWSIDNQQTCSRCKALNPGPRPFVIGIPNGITCKWDWLTCTYSTAMSSGRTIMEKGLLPAVTAFMLVLSAR